MENMGFKEMQEMQSQLQEKYYDKWGGLSPQKAREKLLWMIGEVGEVADVIKKNGDDCIMNDKTVRSHFIEEMCDVLMYFNDVLLCYEVSPQEFTDFYSHKHQNNMNRW